MEIGNSSSFASVRESSAKTESKAWILYSFMGMCCLLFTNFCLSTIGNKAGPYLFFYFSTGQAFAGAVFNIWDMRQ